MVVGAAASSAPESHPKLPYPQVTAPPGVTSDHESVFDSNTLGGRQHTVELNRRSLIKGTAGLGALAVGVPPGLPRARGSRHFRTDMPAVNFENGYFGANPQIVGGTYTEKNRIIHEQNSWFLRNDYEKHITEVRARFAKAVGCSVNEIATTRGATEALPVMTGGYYKLKPGDAVAWT